MTATPGAKLGGLRRRILLGTGLVVVPRCAGWYGEHWWTVGRFTVSTDDAYVYAHNTTLAAKVPGYVAEIRVTDNARVHAGDLIASIDDGDYRLAVDQARDKVASQEATIVRIGRQVDASRAAVDQAKAQLASTEAGMVRADLELDPPADFGVARFCQPPGAGERASQPRPGARGGDRRARGAGGRAGQRRGHARAGAGGAARAGGTAHRARQGGA